MDLPQLWLQLRASLHLVNQDLIICKHEILVDFNLAVAKVDRQTTKFNSPPKFPAIRYVVIQATHRA